MVNIDQNVLICNGMDDIEQKQNGITTSENAKKYICKS